MAHYLTLTAEEKIARLDAPIKPEFCRLLEDRKPVEELFLAGNPSNQNNNAETDVDTAHKSRNDRKRERGQQRSMQLCHTFTRGTCDRGDACKFNHDVAAYLKSKEPDLPGKCPFDASENGCLFGIACRWAGSHTKLDPVSAQYLDTTAQAAAVPPAQADIGVNTNNDQINSTATIAVPPIAAASPSTEQGAAPLVDVTAEDTNVPLSSRDTSWWKKDGSIITNSLLELPLPANVEESLNSLTNDVKFALRKFEYDFSRADAILASLGVNNACKQRERQKNNRNNDRNNNKNNRNRNRDKIDGDEQNETTKTQVDGGDVDVLESTKRQKVESDTGFIEAIGSAVAAVPILHSLEEEKEGQQKGEGNNAAAPPLNGDTLDAKVDANDADYVETKMKPQENKSIDFRDKLYLAPLTTVGNLPFRRLCKSLGADITCGEMALATNLLQGHPSEWALLKRHPDEDLFAVQVCGGYGDAMTRCAQLIEETCQVDFVDINFGCPIDIVCGRGAGSACLQRPQRMQDIVSGMSSILTCPLTLKMRKGYNDGSDIAHELIPKVAACGAAAVTLHGRTRQQRYSRPADWEYIRKCAGVAQEAGVQLVGNGDVFSYEDHYNHVENEGVATTYIARGALIKPWIFTEIKERRHWDISATERLDHLKKFVAMGLEHWGSDTRGVESTRKFLLEWMSFTHRYIPVGLLEVLPQKMNWRPTSFVGRSDLETLLGSPCSEDWVKISEMLLGPAPKGFVFTPKHKATSHATGGGSRKGGRDNGAANGAAKIAEESQENG